MATLHKCDKCGKIIKGNEVRVSFNDIKKRFFADWYNNFDICERCAKPLVVYIRKFFKINKKHKK